MLVLSSSRGNAWAAPGESLNCVRTCAQACVAACGLACRSACGFPEPRVELRAALREPRADLRVACAAGFCGPHPPPAPSDQLSRGWGFRRTERNSFRAFAFTIPSGCNLLLPEGIHTQEEFFQTCKGRGMEARGSVRTRTRGGYQQSFSQFSLAHSASDACGMWSGDPLIIESWPFA